MKHHGDHGDNIETIKVAWAGGVSRNIVFPPSAKPVFGQSNVSFYCFGQNRQNAWMQAYEQD
jgi:hypothetical protein